MHSLYGHVTLVTGASRGIGKGIARSLGAAGATVYLTGRTEHPDSATVPLPGTIHATADLVTQEGGLGIAMRCDHRDDQQVRAVFDWSITLGKATKPNNAARRVASILRSGNCLHPFGTRCLQLACARTMSQVVMRLP